jgi:hypothetical protein
MIKKMAARDPQERLSLMTALDEFAGRVRLFRRQPFPTHWAKVVNGVGLVSLVTRVERTLGEVAALGGWNPDYLRATGQAHTIDADLREMLASFNQVLPALTAEPRQYFEQCRSLVADATALADAWWAWADGREKVRREH